jgi:hypothetical protein
MNEDRGKRFADKTARAARETFEKGSAAAEESARMERSYSSAAEGIGPDADRHAKVLIIIPIGGVKLRRLVTEEALEQRTATTGGLKVKLHQCTGEQPVRVS